MRAQGEPEIETSMMEPAQRPLVGRLRVPGDKSMAHRALLLAAIAEGPSCLRGLPDGADVIATRHAMEAMGVTVNDVEPGLAVVEGKGTRGLSAPKGPIDCGNSATTARLLAGMLAGREFSTTIIGDRSLSSRPMESIVEPLRRMGARILAEGATGGLRLPLVLEGGDGSLLPLHYVTPFASAQVKSCLLLAGLRARGVTAVTEPAQSRDHTETMLSFCGVDVVRRGLTVSVRGPVSRLEPLELAVPGDPSSAAFLLVAGLLVPGSKVEIEKVCLNPTRVGFVDVLRRMGAAITAEMPSEVGGEVVGTLRATAGEPLIGIDVPSRDIPRLIDEIPILAVAAALASGETRFRGCEQLRAKETDRIAAIAGMLAAFGVAVEELPDGLIVNGTGGRPPRGGGRVESRGDHRIAMAAMVLSLFADAPTELVGQEAVAVSYPGFRQALSGLMSK